MRYRSIAIPIATIAAIWTPAVAAKPVKENRTVETHMENAVMQPFRDINLKRDKIPRRLLEIKADPYNLEYIQGCRTLMTEIVSLRPILGPDVNEVEIHPLEERREASISRIAGGIIGGLIPFRGLVRELSGANAHERNYLAALSAGLARRSFLKGIAVAEGCIPAPPRLRLSLAYDLQGF